MNEKFKFILDSNFTQIESIKDCETLFSRFGVDNIDSLIENVESLLLIPKVGCFYSISSSITFLLSRLYQINGNMKKFIQYSMISLSSNYSSFLSSLHNQYHLNALFLSDSMYLDLTGVPFLPFECSWVFNGSYVSPLSAIPIKLYIKSHIDVTMDALSINCEHSITGKQIMRVLEEKSIVPKKNYGFEIVIPIQEPGILSISSIILTISKLELCIPCRRKIGNNIEVMSYESEFKCSITLPTLSITNSPYEFIISCENIPPDVLSSKVLVTHNASPNDLIFYNQEFGSAQTFNSHIDTLKTKCQLLCTKKGTYDFSIQVSLFNDQTAIRVEEKHKIRFIDPFSVKFNIYDTDRKPFSLKTKPFLYLNAEYFITATLEYNLPTSASLKSIASEFFQGTEFSMLPIDIPMDIEQNEAITAVWRFQATNAEIGSITMTYSLDGNDYHFKALMPTCSIIDLPFSVATVFSDNIFANVESNITISIESNIHEQTEFLILIHSSDSIEIKNPRVCCTIQGKSSITIPFLPINDGYLTFPEINVSPQNTLIDLTWRSRYFIQIRKSNNR